LADATLSLAVAASAAGLVAGSAFAQPRRTLSFKELNEGSQFHFVDATPKSKRRHGAPVRLSPGDAFVIIDPLVSDSGRRLGRLRAVCFAVKSARATAATLNCIGVFALRRGNLYLSARLKFTGPATRGKVVGGSGAYAGARGTFVSKNTSTGSDDTVTLTS